jgi:hypothetical protein
MSLFSRAAIGPNMRFSSATFSAALTLVPHWPPPPVRAPPAVSPLSLLLLQPTGSAFKRPQDTNVLSDYSPADLGSLTADELMSIYKHYDRKDVGYLVAKSPDFERMARHVVTRIEAMFCDDYSRQMNTPPEAQVLMALERERVYLMPGAGKDVERNVKDMVVYMFKGMDINKDGRVTMQEFSIAWADVMAKLFVSRNAKSSKGCTIL